MPHALWQDTTLPAKDRVSDLLGQMTLEEKVAQLYGVWVGVSAEGEEVAPHQHDLADSTLDWKELISAGLGQLTRPFGTAPADPAVAVRALAKTQSEIVASNRFGIPAVAHEECLSGFMAWQATTYPTPLAWGASFDPELVERMAAQIGSTMRSLGIHQGLAPVLDVTRDPRWGRTEETIGEDPYLVGTIGTAYVRGLESSGIVATLKHFAGYSASRAARNLGPSGIGQRELADILLPPFEMALREGGARSVMHSYTEIDGVPAAASEELLTRILREEWGFTGTVVADYFGISFLELLHGVAGTPADAARLALTAGVDVELPTVRCYRDPLIQAVRDGSVPESLVDRAARRVLEQKCELGLLDPDWSPGGDERQEPIDLDPPEARALARELAEKSIVLLANGPTARTDANSTTTPDGEDSADLHGSSKDDTAGATGPGVRLPLPADARLAVVGPVADDPMAMLGCYAFPSHLARHQPDGRFTGVTVEPDKPLGIEIRSVVEALRTELPRAGIEYAQGCEVEGTDRSGFAAAVELASNADICVAVLGDRSGLFGHGTSGEGCDAEDLRLPGVQEELLDALLDTGTPVVLVVLSGRPYALGRFVDRLAAIVQAFFPGEEGASAVAGVLSGRVCPSGRLPVSVPWRPGGQPATYLGPPLAHASKVSNIDPTPLFPFGHGLSYTTFAWEPPAGEPDGTVEVPTDGTVSVKVVVRNTGDRRGTEVVQLYLHDPVAQVTRPVNRLIGYARVDLDPGEACEVGFDVHADLTSFVGLSGARVVEPGDLEFRLGASSGDIRHVVRARLTGQERRVGHDRHMLAGTNVRRGIDRRGEAS